MIDGGVDSATVRVSLTPPKTGSSNRPDLEAASAGQLRIEVVRVSSILPGAPVVEGGSLSYRWGDSDPSVAITTAQFNGEQLTTQVKSALGTAFFPLGTGPAADFQTSCAALRDWLTGGTAPVLNSYDLEAVQWAFAFSSSNISRPEIRATDCASKFLQNEAHLDRLRSRGLPIQAEVVPIPPTYQQIMDAAQKAANAANDRANLGAQSYAAGAGAAATGTVLIPAPAPPTPANPATPSANTSGAAIATEVLFQGEKSAGDGVYIGNLRWAAGTRNGDSFFGYVMQGTAGGPAAIATGSGIYSFADNDNSQAAKKLSGARPVRFTGDLLGNLPTFGRLEFEDGSTFEGTFAGGAPFEGVYRLADGTKRYGRFFEYKPMGDGLEKPKNGSVKWGQWIAGNLADP